MWICSFWRGICSCDCTASVFDIFFDCNLCLLSMFKKSVLPPTFNWYVLSIFTPLSSKSLVKVRWIIVAPIWLLISSPIIGIFFFSNRFAHVFIGSNKDRDAVDKTHTGFKTCLSIKCSCLFRTYRKVTEKYIRPALF